jgi:hypothetical protein
LLAGYPQRVGRAEDCDELKLLICQKERIGTMNFIKSVFGKSKQKHSFESFVEELITIGKRTKTFNEGDTYYFRPKGEGIGLGKDWDARTREIGEELYKMGANKIQLMQNAHQRVVQVLGPIAGRCLEAHWHEIGLNQWKQGKGESWLF